MSRLKRGSVKNFFEGKDDQNVKQKCKGGGKHTYIQRERVERQTKSLRQREWEMRERERDRDRECVCVRV